MNGLGDIALKRLYGSKRNIEKPMLACPFHELGDAAIAIDMHDDEQAGFSAQTDNLTQQGDFRGTTIRFDNNA